MSIGLPVFNGERYLAETLDSLLSQTLDEFELIVSDNASTDGTAAICRRYAELDGRIRYIRQQSNRGASWNHSFAALEARGRYFKWSAGDDLCTPTFLERCVDVLEGDSTAVLCQPQTLEIDAEGRRIGPYRHRLRVTSPHVLERWSDLLEIGYACYHVYGVIRADVLLRTGLMGSFIESDMVLLAELSLRGRFAELDDELFLHRIHPGQSVSVHQDRYDRGGWFDTSKAERLAFPTWRFALEYVRAVRRTPLDPRQRRACLRVVARWIAARRRDFVRDLKFAQRTSRRMLKRKLAAS